MFIEYNANPQSRRVGDCTVRAISAATGQDWDTTFWGLCIEANVLKDMPSSNHVWGSYLRKQGFCRRPIPGTCPDCYTVADFCGENPEGVFIVATQGHVLCVKDGNVMDTWDSSQEVPLYYWKMEENA